MRYIVRLIALGIVAALLAVVPATMSQDDDVVINFYWASAVEGDLPGIFADYAAQFEAENPGVTINPVYTGTYTQTRDTILAEGDSPLVDVAIMLATDMYTFIDDSYIIPLNSFIDEMEDGEAWFDDFFPAFWANSIDPAGNVWSVSFQRSTPIMFYNADLFAEEGIEVPTNNEELIAAAQALHTSDRDGLQIPVAGNFPIWMFQSFANAYGAPLTDGDPTQVTFNAPETLEALEFLTRIGMSVEDGGFGVGPMGGSAWGETPSAFVAGQAAIIYHTIGSLTNILQSADFEVGLSFLPSGPAGEDGTGYGSPTGGGNLYIFDDGSKSEAELQAAWDWVVFLSSAEIQSDWGAATGYIASRISSWEIEPLLSLTEEFPQYAVARDQLDFAYEEFTAYRSVEIQNIINFELSNVISGSVSLDEAASVLENAQAQIDGLLEEFN